MHARAAVWRDRNGRAVKTTTDELYCLAPVLPRDLAARTEDGEYETTLRCRKCLNCRKYECLRTRRRLAAHYKGVTDELWIVTVEGCAGEASRLRTRLHRHRVGAALEGFYRLGDTGFAMVARGERPALQHIRALRTRTVRVEKLGQRRKPREFRALVRGLMAEREHYGAWANRFYHRTLAQHPKETFTIERRGGIRKRHPEAKSGVRAWRRGLWLDASVVTAGSELMALLLKRGGELAGRKCTHGKCPPECCRLKYRAPAATSPVKSGARASAPSCSLNDRISECSAGVSAGVESGGSVRVRAAAAGAATFAPKTNSNSITGGRDAGSLHALSAFSADWLERMRKIARERDG